jgi:hypothetical protein
MIQTAAEAEEEEEDEEEEEEEEPLVPLDTATEVGEGEEAVQGFASGSVHVLSVSMT